MKLYEITQQYLNILESFEYEKNENDGGFFEMELSKINEDFENKADMIACYIKNLEAQILALKNEIDNLGKRRNSKIKTFERLKEYLKKEMIALDKRQIETTRNKIQIHKNPPSIEVDDGFISWAQENNEGLLRYKPPEPDKTKIKKELDDKKELKFVRLIQTDKINIK